MRNAWAKIANRLTPIKKTHHSYCTQQASTTELKVRCSHHAWREIQSLKHFATWGPLRLTTPQHLSMYISTYIYMYINDILNHSCLSSWDANVVTSTHAFIMEIHNQWYWLPWIVEVSPTHEAQKILGFTARTLHEGQIVLGSLWYLCLSLGKNLS